MGEHRKGDKRLGIRKIISWPGKIKTLFSVSDIIQIVIACCTFLSFVGVLLTLGEMQKERNAAYKPTILMNAVDFEISWDTNGEEEWVSSLPDESNSSYEVDAEGNVAGTISLPVNIFPHNGLESFTVVNVGVGAAKDVYFEWDKNNIPYLCNYLAECDPSKSDFCTVEKSATFSLGDGIVVTDIDDDVRLMYMLPDATETYTLPLPTAYSILIHEIMKCTALQETPHIVLYAEYSDIQGENVRDTFYIAINRIYYNRAADNSGGASYQLTPTLLAE